MIYFLIIVVIYSICFLNRNQRVYRECQRILEIISEQSRKDIKKGKDFVWRYDEFSQVSYHKMMWFFWKPVKSFYKHISDREK